MKHFLLASAISLIFIYGCAQPQNISTSFPTKECSTPLAEIYVESITHEKNDLNITPEFIKALLEKNLKDNCLVIAKEPSSNTYLVKINYKTSLQSSSDEKIASSEVKNILSSEVTLSLKNKTTTKNFKGKNSIRINGKKILSIGQDASITQEDKNQSTNEAFQAAYHSMLNSFDTGVK
ncbi:hypothetical protein BKH41_06965 [Helicobacter sp. 12S02232-10]|uniref:hypothetical protein n=1 Tax=Helicobacter sp. 12S02232-10 TaxID=1476197 RepID=UPI000BA622D0|nr:hypothetical protein [Helicobacter sp. 12S02232-10]PAF47631.1 hypothetical protein BKH41_06965 [Helicobacter sp. 12S02232-10]